MADVIYDEPGGRWIVRDTLIWDVHAKQAATSLADDRLVRVTTGLSGECEERFLLLQRAEPPSGAYLRAHPAGRHAAEAMGAVNKLLERVVTSGKVNPGTTSIGRTTAGSLAWRRRLSSAIRRESCGLGFGACESQRSRSSSVVQLVSEPSAARKSC
jgi:hypothetical protein